MAVRGVSALIGEALDLARGNRAVLMEPRDDMEADGVAHAVRDEGLLARAVDAHAAPCDLRGAPRAQWLVERVLLVAKAAADVGLDDAHVCPRTPKRLTDNAADDVRDLRGGNDDDAPVFLVGIAAVVFNVAVLHGGSIVPALDLDESGLLNGLLIISLADIRVLQDIPREIFVDAGRVGLHGLLHVEHKREFLIFDLQRAHALHGRDLILRNDDRDVVAVVAHMAVQKIAVGHVLMPRVHRPGMARRREAVLRHVEAGQHLHNAGDGLRRGLVDGFDKSVRDGGMFDARIERTGRHPILIVFRASGDLVERIDADLAFSYLAHLSTSCSEQPLCRFCSKSATPLLLF